jgi:aspartokinase-like uncharacterized kinase
MWVVKLGGSLSRDPRLPEWLQMLAEFGGGLVTVVPGGAGFADAVREAQVRWHFDDVVAHNMAVLAMAQTAHMLHALEPRLVIAADDAQIRQALHAGRAALWLPLALLRDAPDMLTSWEVSSDSLALWLARRLNAERLVVVKSCSLNPALTLAELTATGVLDARFPDWAHEAAFRIEIVQVDELARVRDALVSGVGLGAALPGMLQAAKRKPAARTAAMRGAKRKPVSGDR